MEKDNLLDQASGNDSYDLLLTFEEGFIENFDDWVKLVEQEIFKEL